MLKPDKWLSCCFTLVVSAFLFLPSIALAEDADNRVIEEVLVTGSAIRGTPIDSESPVTILDRDTLQKQGAPSVIQMVRRLSASSGIDGETNQFQANASEGIANVNLRGLGAARTLVLLNGKRAGAVPVRLPSGRFTDINNFPSMAIERVEVLKEGAAATYGSDAIGGVVNFITRKNFEGVQVSASYTDIDASDGDYELGIIAGKAIGDWNLVGSVGYQKRNELALRDRDFSTGDFAVNPAGGFSSIGNPGVLFNPAAVPAAINFGNIFAVLAPGFGGVKDPNCELLGGVDDSLFCRFRYTDFDNLVEKQERLQVFTEANGYFGNDIQAHVELLYATNEVPEWKTSPSYPPQALFGDIQYIPNNHPGLIDMAGKHPEYAPFLAAGGTFYGRLRGVGSDAGREAAREYETWRFSSSLIGDLNDSMSWEVGFTYSNSQGDLGGVDAQIGRTKLAFSGYGGNNCAATLDAAGNFVINGAVQGENGCLWYNPLSNAIAVSNAQATEGVVNPDFNAAVANSAEVLAYLDDLSITKTKSEMYVFDASLQGAMFDEAAAWVFGYQYRRFDTTSKPSDLTNLAINPCQFVGQTDCSAQTGLRSFLSGGRVIDDDQDVHSLFLELALHINEDLDVQIATRYEDYGSKSTLDPKLAVRYGFNDQITLRGSVQTTFRGPTIDHLTESAVTTLSFVGPTAAFKAIDTVGNADLDPEEAFTYNLGIVLDPFESLRATVDYWFYDFKNPIVSESFNSLVNAYQSLEITLADGDSTAEQIENARIRKEAVQSQIFCTGGLNDGSCGAAAIERIVVQTINGPSIKTSGIDVFINYSRELGPGQFTLGLDMSHTLNYKTKDYFKGGALVTPGFEAAGFLNESHGVRSIPDLKGRISAEYNWDAPWGNNNALLMLNYITDYTDERTVGIEGVEVVKIASQTTLDFHYQVQLFDGSTQLTLSAVNLTDEDPPLTLVDLNYDAFTHSGIGRQLKIGLTHTFGGR